MKLTYDPRYNVGYIRFKEKDAEVESIKLSDEIVMDSDPMQPFFQRGNRARSLDRAVQAVLYKLGVREKPHTLHYVRYVY